MSFSDKDIQHPEESVPLQIFAFDVENSEITSVTNPRHNELPSSGKLIITEQPIEMMAFRSESEMTTKGKFTPRGYVYNRNGKRGPIIVQLNAPNLTDGERLYIRCTLYQSTLENNSNGGFWISPHKLCHANKTKGNFDSENNFYEMESVKHKNCYQFQLIDFVIIKPKQEELFSSCVAKHNELLEQNKLYGIIYDNVAPYAPPHEDMEINNMEMRICFEAFRRTSNGTYQLVAGPAFSDTITESKNVNIVKICNVNGNIKGGTDVTLLVDGFNINTNYSVEIADNSGWKESKNIEEVNTHANKAVWFNMPPYLGSLREEESIDCVIKLKREKDGKLSNGVPFTYTTKSIWSSSFIIKSKSTKRKVDALFLPKTIGKRKYSADLPKTSESEENAPPTQDLAHSTLSKISAIHKASENESNYKKLEISKILMQYFEYYEQESPCSNSLIHDILQDDDLSDFEMPLLKIIQDFNLRDLIRKSINIYGHTTLMFACMFNKPQLICDLIKMECPIDAKNLEDGNNVLHMIAQQQSETKSQTLFLQTVQFTRNAMIVASFKRALRAYNLSGLTPLHIAVMNNDIKLVDHFLLFCKKHNALDIIACGRRSDGNTILHQAVINKSKSMYSFILKFVPDSKILNVENYSGKTAEDIRESMDEPLIDELVQSIAALNLDFAETVSDSDSDEEPGNMQTSCNPAMQFNMLRVPMLS